MTTNNTTALTLWNETDVALVKSMVADKATPEEFRLLIHLANKYRLDPLARQIYCVKYGNKPASIFAGLAGFVEIAQRSGHYDGIVPEVRTEDTPIHIEYTYYDEDRRRQQGVFDRAYQFVATATVHHKQMAHPVVVTVWEEEYSSGRDLWRTKPRTMIQKVAMCQALRLAFNISGLYDPDEINEGVMAPPTITAHAMALKRLDDGIARAMALPPPVDAETGEIFEGVATEVPTDRAQAPVSRSEPARPTAVPPQAGGNAGQSTGATPSQQERNERQELSQALNAILKRPGLELDAGGKSELITTLTGKAPAELTRDQLRALIAQLTPCWTAADLAALFAAGVAP